jgi:hypothetical protein
MRKICFGNVERQGIVFAGGTVIKPKKRKNMNPIKKICFLLAFICVVNSLNAQTKDYNTILGAGLFYINEKETPTPGYWYWHHQAAANAYFGYDLFKNYYRLGAEMRIMHHWGEIYPPRTFYMVGWYNQFNIFPKAKWGRMFIELGLHQGNMYPVKNSYETQVVSGLFYLGFGYGGNIRLSPHLDLAIGANLYPILNQDYFFYNYGNYEIGLEYAFGARNSRRKVLE